MTKAFASQADTQEKKISFTQMSAHCWAYTAEGDPNSGVIIGDDFVLVSDATATPDLAQDLIARIRQVTDKPIKYVLLTHYHAVRVLGASAFKAEGATEVIASRGTYELIVERGAQDMQSEMDRFPRLFRRRAGADLASRRGPYPWRHDRVGRRRRRAVFGRFGRGRFGRLHRRRAA
jgi:glyoxylase-like metal-dependent hydrolase (beta-lactamase superfamily II)